MVTITNIKVIKDFVGEKEWLAEVGNIGFVKIVYKDCCLEVELASALEDFDNDDTTELYYEEIFMMEEKLTLKFLLPYLGLILQQ